jgi:hypothetical protein
MGRVSVEVIGKALIMSGGVELAVGERLGLDDSNTEHALIIKRGWVRVHPAPLLSKEPLKSLEHQPNKMIRKRQARRKQI